MGLRAGLWIVALGMFAACSDDAAVHDGAAQDGGPHDGSADAGAMQGDAASARGDAGRDGSAGASADASATDAASRTNPDGAAPSDFWEASEIPKAKNVMMFKFLNRTNGKFSDAEVFWSFKSGNIAETHSIAEQSTYDMPANSSGRMYFYLCGAANQCSGDPTKSKYYDFIEHTIGANQYNGNTTRVDAFGIKLALRLHCADGFDTAFGEDYETFAEDRATTFQKFIDEVPDEFKPLARAPYAPYRIVEPGADAFKKGGSEEHYYDALVDQIWSANGITIPKPGPNGSGLAAYPDLSAAIFRHVGMAPGSFGKDGKLVNKDLWKDPSTFYATAPANFYAQFWHRHGLHGRAYGFPYDDVGSYSSYVSHKDPETMLVAIGW